MAAGTDIQAKRLHEGLSTAFERFYGAAPEARFERRGAYVRVTFPTFPLPQFNGVYVESSDPGAAVAELAAAIDEVEQLGLPAGVQLRADRAPEVEEEARRLGLSAEMAIPGMAVAAEDLAAPIVPGLEFVRVEDEDGLAEAARTAAVGFGAPLEWMKPLYSAEIAALPGLQIFLGRVDGETVSTALGFAIDGAVGIFNVATPPEHRRRGYGAALTAHAAREAIGDGADLAWLQSSELGEPVYRALGFRQVETYLLLSRPE